MANSQQHFAARRAWMGLLAALMLAGSAVVAWYATFSVFNDYDDEGYVMTSLQSFLDGHRLYDEVYTQYGPFYFLYEGALHRLTGLPVSHDVGRVTTVVVWVATTLLCALFTYRTTRSPLLAAAAQLVAFRALSMISNEPGHPQEICALLLAGGVLLGSFADDPKRLWWLAPSLGMVAGALSLTKINIGFFFCLALAGAAVAFASSERARRIGPWLLLGMAAIVPAGLMRAHLGASWGENYAAVATITCVSTLAVAMFRRGGGNISLALIATVLGGFLIAALAVFLSLLACGTSPGGFWYGLVTNPLHVTGKFVYPLAVSPWGVAAAVVGGVAAAGYCLHRRRSIAAGERSGDASAWLFGVARLLFVVGVAGAGFCVDTRDLLVFATPWVWLAMVHVDGRDGANGNSFSRTWVALVAAFQMLQAYPVAGSQLSVATFLMAPAAAICAADLLRQLQEVGARLPAKTIRAGGAVASLAIVLLWASLGYGYYSDYQRLTSLNLPGAKWIRVSQVQAAILRCVAMNLRDYDTFFTEPGMNCFYFWSEHKPPTTLNPPAWTVLLDEQQQRAIIQEIERHPRACLVRNLRMIGWYASNFGMSQSILSRYLESHFEPQARVGEYDICLRDGETLPPLIEAATIARLPAALATAEGGNFADGRSNTLIQLRMAKDAHPTLSIAAVVVIEPGKRKVLADTRENFSSGMTILDADLKEVRLPLLGQWKDGKSVAVLNLVPKQEWPQPTGDNYSGVFVLLLDENGEVTTTLPMAVRWAGRTAPGS